MHILYIQIADIICCIQTDNTRIYTYLKNAYIVFPRERIKKPDLTISIGTQKYKYIIDFSIRKRHLEIVVPYIISLNDFEYTIRAFIGVLLAHYEILLLHGSSVFIENNGYIFLGHSGSGKTTILKNSHPMNRMGDDTAVIKIISGKPFIFTSPFDKRKFPGLIERRKELSCLFVLRQASYTKKTKIPFTYTLNMVLHSNIFTILKDNLHAEMRQPLMPENGIISNKNVLRSSQMRISNLCFKLLENTYIYKLHFTRTFTVPSSLYLLDI